MNNAIKPKESNNINSVPFNIDKLKNIVERIKRLEDERKAIGEDITAVYAEARCVGFDAKILREVVKLSNKDQADLFLQEDVRGMYMDALGIGGNRD